MGKHRPEDLIWVTVGGVEYGTYIDPDGVQRFVGDPILEYLYQTGRLDFNKMAVDYHSGKYPELTQRIYAEFNMKTGYSVSGFSELSSFQDMEIINPLWTMNKPKED